MPIDISHSGQSPSPEEVRRFREELLYEAQVLCVVFGIPIRYADQVADLIMAVGDVNAVGYFLDKEEER
jgi:hypothetical protein